MIVLPSQQLLSSKVPLALFYHPSLMLLTVLAGSDPP